MFRRRAIRLKFEPIILQAVSFGLSKEDLQEVRQLVSHNEYGVAVDHIATQLCEHEAEITESFYQEFIAYVKLLGLKTEEYEYLSERVVL